LKFTTPMRWLKRSTRWVIVLLVIAALLVT
jgi:hypothetical protein